MRHELQKHNTYTKVKFIPETSYCEAESKYLISLYIVTRRTFKFAHENSYLYPI